jgi:phosphoribosylformimino-5-aminoimidazole carboxamide ribotide isomerase
VIVFPAVDIRRGKCVRLVQGDVARETVYSDEPAEMARRWAMEGAEWIHVVDLDGAFGTGSNLEVIRAVRARVDCRLQMGGGLRSLETVRAVLGAGIDRVVLGTAVFKDPDWVRRAAAEFPDRVLAGIDAHEGEVKVEGWQEGSGQPVTQALRHVEGLGIGQIVFTDISKDGALEGPAVTATRTVLKSCKLGVIASGGVSSADDVKALKALEADGLRGCIVGKALYDGRLTLAAAIAAAK